MAAFANVNTADITFSVLTNTDGLLTKTIIPDGNVEIIKRTIFKP